VKAGEEEGYETKLVRGSQELKQRWRGGAMVEEGDGGKLHDAWELERGRELESGVKRHGEGWGWCSPFIGTRDHPRGGCRGVPAGVNGWAHWSPGRVKEGVLWGGIEQVLSPEIDLVNFGLRSGPRSRWALKTITIE
jgi:hypothetical protein